MDIEWKNVNIISPTIIKKGPEKYVHLIKNACGYANSGNILAVMGPSGAGKTTLLKALVGRIQNGSKTNGEILCGGKERQIAEWVSISAYVDQDDNIYENFTVYETVYYAAKFRCRDQNNLDEKVKKILQDLRIDKIAQHKMNNISGGERKRTMIAVELVTDAQLIFLDEPTSGLDAYIATSFIKLLKEYAKKYKKTVVLTIHQPPLSVFKQFDDLLLLVDGRTIYCGPANQADSHFESYGIKNETGEVPFVDFILETLTEPTSQETTILHKLESDLLIKYATEIETGIERTSNDNYLNFVPDLRHIATLMDRRMRIYLFTLRSIFGIIFRGLFSIGFAKLLNSVYTTFVEEDDGKNGIMYALLVMLNASSKDLDAIKKEELEIASISLGFILVSSVLIVLFYYIATMTSISSISNEYKTVKREIAVNTYSLSSYFLSVYLFDSLQGLIFAILTVIMLITTSSIESIPFIYSLMLVLGIFVFTLFFLSIGCISSNNKINIVVMALFSASSVIPAFSVMLFKKAYDHLVLKILHVIILTGLPHHFAIFFLGLTLTSSCDGIKDPKAREALVDCIQKNIISPLLEFYWFLGFNIYSFALVFFSVLCGLVVIAMLLLGRLMKPNFRMRLKQ